MRPQGEDVEGRGLFYRGDRTRSRGVGAALAATLLASPLFGPLAGREARADRGSNRAGVRLYVDGNGASGEDTFATIGDALERADAIPQPVMVEIVVRPGTYLLGEDGPGDEDSAIITLDRPHTALVAASGPLHDSRGFLVGYATPVTLEVTRPLRFFEDVIRVVEDSVTVAGFRIAGEETVQFNLNAAVRVVGHVPTPGWVYPEPNPRPWVGDEILHDVTVRDLWVTGIEDTPLWVREAEAVVEQCVVVGPAFIAVELDGGYSENGPPPRITVQKNTLEQMMIGVDVHGQPLESNQYPTGGDGGIVARILDNQMRDAIASWGFNVYLALSSAVPRTPATGPVTPRCRCWSRATPSGRWSSRTAR